MHSLGYDLLDTVNDSTNELSNLKKNYCKYEYRVIMQHSTFVDVGYKKLFKYVFYMYVCKRERVLVYILKSC